MMTNLRGKKKRATGLAIIARWQLGYKHPQASQRTKKNSLLQVIAPLKAMQIMTNRFENSVDCLFGINWDLNKNQLWIIRGN